MEYIESFVLFELILMFVAIFVYCSESVLALSSDLCVYYGSLDSE